jgi:H+-transporting ATPase
VLSFSLVFVGLYVVRWPLATLQSVVFLYLLFSGQATLYLLRERGPFYSSRPSTPLIVASAADITALSLMATFGVLMAPVAPVVILVLLGLVALAAGGLDRLKLWLFRVTESGGDLAGSSAPGERRTPPAQSPIS